LKAGATIEAAMTAYAVKLEKENARLAEEAKKAAETVAAAGKAKVDPAVQAFADDAANKKNQPPQPATDEAGWKKEFAEKKELQEEFGEEKTYLAYKKNEEHIKIKKG
jgi:hypothetical protein